MQGYRRETDFARDSEIAGSVFTIHGSPLSLSNTVTTFAGFTPSNPNEAIRFNNLGNSVSDGTYLYMVEYGEANMGKKDGEIQVYGVGKVSPKGQIVIPAELREELGIRTGDQLVIAKGKSGEGVLLLKIEVLNRLLSGTRYNIE